MSYEDLPIALKKVPRALTQAPADTLLDYSETIRQLRRLSQGSRTRLQFVGRSVRGRRIPLIIITEDIDHVDLAGIRRTAAELMTPAIMYNSLTDLKLSRPQLETPPIGFRLPILFQSSNFGMEAAQLEAFIRLMTQIEEDQSKALSDVLSHIVLLIVPLINPDGRERGIAHWRERPMSPARRAQGNQWDIEVTREFLHLLQPETAAMARIVREWHPFLVWEVHEDGIGLGWTHDEVCLCPPITPYGKPGVDSPISPAVNNHALFTEYQAFGSAIAEAWKERGYHYLHDPRGEHGWPKHAKDDEFDFPPAPETRLTQAMPLRGVPAFITESGRVPGSQTWDDRIGQKVTAGRAILSLAADRADSLIDVARTAQRVDTSSPAPFFEIPLDQPMYTLARAIAILTAHGIAIFRAASGSSSSTIVVPAAQPLRPTVDLLLDLAIGQHQSLVAALGLRVIPSTSMADGRVKTLSKAQLDQIESVEDLLPDHEPVRSVNGYTAIENSTSGVALVSRILRVPGARVRWHPAPGPERRRTLIARMPDQDADYGHLTHGLHVGGGAATAADFDAAPMELGRPRIGIYTGQGVHENSFNGSLLGHFLDKWELPWRCLGPTNLEPSTLSALDVLIFPAGSATAMTDGVEANSMWHRWPWEFDYDPVRMPDDTASAISDWIRDGGYYIGLDAGGGALACTEGFGLLDASVSCSGLGTGLITIQVTDPQNPLFDQVAGAWNESGECAPDIFYGMYVSNTSLGQPGGCFFRVGDSVDNLATVLNSRPVSDIPHIVQPPLTVASDAIIAHGARGRGHIYIMGIEPTYRATFDRTARLLSNLILLSGTSTSDDVRRTDT